VWAGTFDSLDNNCPFLLAANVDPVFPLVVKQSSDGVFTILGADGSTTAGGQGDGEEISFSANANSFGDVGSTFPYECTTTARITFLSIGSSESEIAIVYSFEDCVTPLDPTDSRDCFATYYYKGMKI